MSKRVLIVRRDKPNQQFGLRRLRVIEERESYLGLRALISGVSYPGISYIGENKEKAKTTIKAASSISWIEKSQKLKELARLIRG